MRLIDTTPFDIKFMDIPDGTEDYKRGYVDGARHVLEEMDEAPTVDAAPLDKLCEYRDIITCGECRKGRIHEKGRVMCNGMWHKENFFCADAKRIETEEETNESE